MRRTITMSTKRQQPLPMTVLPFFLTMLLGHQLCPTNPNHWWLETPEPSMDAPHHDICWALESKLSFLVRLLGTFAVPFDHNVMCMKTHKSKCTHERWDAVCRFGQVSELWWPPIPADADIATSTPEPAKIPKPMTLLWEKRAAPLSSLIVSQPLSEQKILLTHPSSTLLCIAEIK